MVRHGYKILCVISAVFVLLFSLFDDNVLGGPHLCGSVIKSFRFSGEMIFPLGGLSVTVALRL